jgi:hypothetical protein
LAFPLRILAGQYTPYIRLTGLFHFLGILYSSGQPVSQHISVRDAPYAISRKKSGGFSR